MTPNNDDALVEAMARALHAWWGSSDNADYTYPWGSPQDGREMFFGLARAALTAHRNYKGS